ncbi:MAG: hypothetical protein IJY61_00270 [Candidatus Gastranaerophilales bacterium]|nr:hypothetical protein [Candidatus Gastranaerophilales bacterium]
MDKNKYKNKGNSSFKTKNDLLMLNLLFTVFVIAINIFAFIFINSGKDGFTRISAYANGALFFGYIVMLSELARKNVMELKKEALYINYPVYIGAFLGFNIVTLLFSAICLFSVNPEAANVTFIFTFFMSTIAMLFPSILMLVFMFFVVPAFIIPALSNRKNKPSNFILKFLFICFLGFCIFNVLNAVYKISTIKNQKKFKSAKLTMKYSSEFLKFKDVGSYTIKLLSRNDVSIPLFYTQDTIPLKEQYEAEIFCNSMGARVPDYLETYNIVFNKFDTFGEKYYWTSDKDGKHSLVLHYKNMSYNIVRKPEGVTPVTYCVAKDNTNYGFGAKHFFYREVEEIKKEAQTANKKPFDMDFFKELTSKDIEQTYTNQQKQAFQQPVEQEKKYVNFSVKEVSQEILNDLLAKGYYYNPDLTIRPEYETNDAKFLPRIRMNSNDIRLCYYPFAEYGNMSLSDEQQIWQQSFCSPAFELIETSPVLKSRFEKEAYCYTKGGRLPNIPELTGILKTLGRTQAKTKYWTNNKINNSEDVLVYYKDARFMQVQKLKNNEIDNAYVYCIKNSKSPSRIIANYNSRFRNVSGKNYASLKCPSCYYYEVPDVILQQ